MKAKVVHRGEGVLKVLPLLPSRKILIIHQAHKRKIDQNSAKSCGKIKQHRPYQSGKFIQPFIHLSSIDSIQKYSLLAKFIADETLSKSDFKSNLHPYKRLVTEIILCEIL